LIPGKGDASITTAPSIAQDGAIVIGTCDGNLYAITNGALEWAFNAGTGIQSTAAIAADNTVYFAAGGQNNGINTFYAVTNGSVRWSFNATNAPNACTGSPVIGPDATVYFSGGGGNVYAFCGSAPLATSSWPMFQKNPQHTANQQVYTEIDEASPPFPTDFEEGETFSVFGPINANWEVYRSTTLLNWVDVGPLINVQGEVEGDGYFYENPPDPYAPNLYYVMTDGSGHYSYVIGRTTVYLGIGTNYVVDPFQEVDDDFAGGGRGPMNTLWPLFYGYGRTLPPGTTVTTTTPPVGTYILTTDGYWLPNADGTLPPNEPFIVNATGPTTNIFDGVFPPNGFVNNISSGTNYLSSITSGGLVTDLGFTNASPNDQIGVWNASSQSFLMYINLAGSGWSPSEPNITAFQPFMLITTNTTTWTQTFPLP
jgi:hypothetical protein